MDEAEKIKREKMRELRKKALEPEKAEPEYPSSPVEVDDSTLSRTVKSYPLVLVDFYADWCQPCRMMAPMLEEIARELTGKVVVAKLDVDGNPNAAMEFRASSIPTLLIFKQGKVVDRVTGAVPKQALVSRLKGLF